MKDTVTISADPLTDGRTDLTEYSYYNSVLADINLEVAVLRKGRTVANTL